MKDLSRETKQERGEATKDLIMRSAETLFAEKGLENVSVRAIIVAAKQKNESALQYYFGSRKGLIVALQKQRGRQVNLKRKELLDALLGSKKAYSVRDICELLLEPPCVLCRTDIGFRNFVSVFSQPVVASGDGIVSVYQSQEDNVVATLEKLLRPKTPKIPKQLFARRFQDALTYATQQIGMRARSKASFKGKKADLFLHNMVDTMEAILTSPPSKQTKQFI